MFGGHCNTLFITKCLLRQSPLTYVLGTMCLGIGVFGWMFMISEAPLDRVINDGPIHTFENSCWAAICTMTTVGFGDVYPRTPMGRATAFLCALFGIAIVSLMVVTFNSILTMDSPESQSYTILKKLKVRQLIKDVAVKLLITINRKHSTDENSEYLRYSKIKQLIDRFRSLRRRYKVICEPNVIDEFNKSFNGVLCHITDVKDMIIDQNEWYEEMFYTHPVAEEETLETSQTQSKSPNPESFEPSISK